MNNVIDFNQYKKRVLKFESLLEDKQYDLNRLKKILNIAIISSFLVNEVKREIFYDKSDPDKFEQLENSLLKLITSKDKTNIVSLKEYSNLRVLHGVLGLNTESTETLEAQLKAINTKNLDMTNLREELGDIFWYLAVIQDELKLDLNETLDINAKKLELRFKNKAFSKENALNRDITSEHKVLEFKKK